MSDKPKQRLIIISGSPCVGKTTVATALFESYENSAYCDGDWVWCVNPFSIDDPRLRCGDKNMSFVISTYLNAHFDTVILSTVVAMYPSIREPLQSTTFQRNQSADDPVRLFSFFANHRFRTPSQRST